MSKVSIPFGKKTLVFPYNPFELRNLIIGLVASRGAYSTNQGFGGTYEVDELIFLVDQDKETRRWSVSVLSLYGYNHLDMDGVGEESFQIHSYRPGPWEQLLGT